jgi:hypothetical protein
MARSAWLSFTLVARAFLAISQLRALYYPGRKRSRYVCPNLSVTKGQDLNTALQFRKLWLDCSAQGSRWCSVVSTPSARSGSAPYRHRQANRAAVGTAQFVNLHGQVLRALNAVSSTQRS